MTISRSRKILIARVVARVVESGLGGARDLEVMEAAHAMRWDPVRLEGQPIPAWKPYVFTLRRP